MSIYHHQFIPQYGWIPFLFRLITLLSITLIPLVGKSQNLVESGGRYTQEILTLGEEDQWTFSISKPSRIWVQVASNNQLTPRVKLLAPNGTIVDEDSDSNVAIINTEAQLKGDYLILVDDDNGIGGRDTGVYQISTAFFPGSFIVQQDDEGGPISNGLLHMGTIELGDLDLWSMELEAAEPVWIRCARTTGGLTPQIQIFDPNGQSIGFESDGRVAEISIEATIAGTYTIIVADEPGNGGDDTGSYNLHVVRPLQTFEDGEEIDGGQLINGDNQHGILSAGDMDPWIVHLAEGESIWLRVSETDGGLGLTPLIRLFDPDGNLIASDSSARITEIMYTAIKAGRYIAVIADDLNIRSENTGGYRMTNVKAPGQYIVPEDDDGGALINGFNHRGGLGPGDLDFWTAHLEKGDFVVLNVATVAGSVTPLIQWYEPSGSPLFADSDSILARSAFQAEKSGDYLLVVTDDLGTRRIDRGLYQIYFSVMPEIFEVTDGDEGGAIKRNESQLGIIELGDLDMWSFWSDEGTNISIRVDDTSQNGGLTPLLKLFDPDGLLVTSSSDSNTVELNYVTAKNGYYGFIIQDGHGDGEGIGSYSISNNGLPDQATKLRIRRSTLDEFHLHWLSTKSTLQLKQKSKANDDEWEQSNLEPKDNGFNTRVMVPAENDSLFFQLQQSN